MFNVFLSLVNMWIICGEWMCLVWKQKWQTVQEKKAFVCHDHVLVWIEMTLWKGYNALNNLTWWMYDLFWWQLHKQKQKGNFMDKQTPASVEQNNFQKTSTSLLLKPDNLINSISTNKMDNKTRDSVDNLGKNVKRTKNLPTTIHTKQTRTQSYWHLVVTERTTCI